MEFLTPFLFSLFNRLRGHINYFGISSRILFDCIMGLVIGIGFVNLAGIEWYWSLLFIISFWAGETPQTGKWIGILVSRRHLQGSGASGFFYQLINIPTEWICKEEDDFYQYACIGLAFRGFLWWAIALLPAFILSNSVTVSIGLAISTTMMSIAFPLSFHIIFRPEGKSLPHIKWLTNKEDTWTELNWAYGELVYGFLFGLVLAVTYYLLS